MKTCKDCPAFRKQFSKECICQCGTTKIRILDVCGMSGFCRTDTRFHEADEDDEMCTRGYLLLACKKQLNYRRNEQEKVKKALRTIDSLNDEIDMLKEYVRSLNSIIDDIQDRS